MKRIYKCAAALLAAAAVFAACALTGCYDLGTGAEKGSRVIAGDAVTLRLLDGLGVDVVAISDDGGDVAEKYAGGSVYPRVGLAMNPEYDNIKLLDPSEFIMSDATEEAFGNIASNLAQRNINYMLMDYNSVNGLKGSITALGEYFGRQERAAEMVAELTAGETAVKEQVAALPSAPECLVLFGAPLGSPSTSISVETDYMFGGSLVSYTGAVNVASVAFPDETRGMFQPTDWDPIIDADPEYILCIAHGRPDEVWDMYDTIWSKPPYSFMSAVRNGNVYYLDSDVINVICTFDYVGSMQYLLDIFAGRIGASI